MSTPNHTITRADGSTLSFAHPTLKDIFGDFHKPYPNGIMPTYRQSLKARLLESLKMAGMAADQIVVELNEFDNQDVGMDEDFIPFLNTPTGRTYLLEFAHAKANNGAELPTLSGAEWNAAIAGLLSPLGVEIAPPKQQDAAGDAPAVGETTATYGDGGDGPNPEAPETYSATPGVMPTTAA